MGLICWLPVFSLLLWIAAPPGRNDAQTALVAQSACQAPVLSRLTHHKVASGETIERIAQRYNLIPATLMGMNPVLRGGKAPVGSDILIPPITGFGLRYSPVKAGVISQSVTECALMCCLMSMDAARSPKKSLFLV